MKLQLWRNSTLQIKTGKINFLIDPMLGKKGSFGVFPWTNDDRENPLVDLPYTGSELASKLKSIDAVLVSHLHPDHWDEAAVNLIKKSTPIVCPEPIANGIASYGFQNIKAIQSQLDINGIQIHLTKGRHGTGEIGKKMGVVHKFILQENEQKVYVAGDTILCQEVKDAIDEWQPQHIAVAGGAVTFAIGEPVTMTARQIKELAAYTPDANIWITHLETISPCKEDRAFIAEFLDLNKLQVQCKILNDGEEVELN